MTKEDRIYLMDLIPKKCSIDQRKDNGNDRSMTNRNGKNGKVTNGNGKSGNNGGNGNGNCNGGKGNGVSGKNNNNKDNNKKRKKKGDDLRGFPHYASLYANNTVDSCERLYTSSLLPARYLILTNLN